MLPVNTIVWREWSGNLSPSLKMFYNIALTKREPRLPSVFCLGTWTLVRPKLYVLLKEYIWILFNFKWNISWKDILQTKVLCIADSHSKLWWTVRFLYRETIHFYWIVKPYHHFLILLFSSFIFNLLLSQAGTNIVIFQISFMKPLVLKWVTAMTNG